MRNLLLAGLFILIAIFCMASQCQPKPILTDLANCEGSAAAKDLPALLPVVGSVILSGGTNAAVDAALIGIAVQFGTDSLDCAVAALRAAWAQLTAPATQPAAVTAALKMMPAIDRDAAERGVKRADAWLGTRGKTLKARSIGSAP